MARYAQAIQAELLKSALCHALDTDIPPYPNYEQTYRKVCAMAKSEILAALNGDPDAARSSVCTADNRYRGHIAVLYYLSDIPLEGYQAALDSVWTMNHRELIEAAKSRTQLRSMLRKAHFPLPDNLPEVVRIWRGTSYLPWREAARGLSWTTDRDCACWFALRFSEKNGSPLVLAADVPKTAILHYTDGRNEAEAVCFDVASPFIDGTASDWQQGYERRCKLLYPDHSETNNNILELLGIG